MIGTRPLVKVIPNTDDYSHLVIDPHAPVQRDEAVDYAAFVTSLEKMIEIRDQVQWSVGDALQGIETKYSDCTIETISDEINMSPSSLYEWRGMCAFYVPLMRDHYRELGLSFSHMRVAYRAFPDQDEAYQFLDECATQKWTVRGSAIEAKERKGIDTAAPLPRLTPDIIAAVRTYQATPWHETQALMVDIVEMVAALIGEGK